jgi:hypothetical protein
LPESVVKFPARRRLVALLRQSGFPKVHSKALTGGIAVLYVARRDCGG